MNQLKNGKGIVALFNRRTGMALALLLGVIATGCAGTDNAVTAPKIVAGAAHACAFDADREQVVCWGDNSYGQLGNNEFSAEGVSAPVRVKVISGRKIKSLSAGYSHTCALVSGGDDDSKNTVACWGYNHYGQVGNGTFNDSNVPVFVNGPDGNPLTGVVNLSAGAYHTCASIVKGSASDPSNYVATTYCWGRNDKGQLGNGALTNVNVPTAIKGLDYSGGVAAGTAHTCALSSKSTDDAQAHKYQVFCWGDASRGQMRDAKVEGGYTTKPIDIGLPLEGEDAALFSEHVVQADVTTATDKPVKGAPALATETPAYGQTCAITKAQVQCWGGTNQNGQWGTDEKGATEHTVKADEIVSGGDLRAYGAGNAQSCMLAGSGSDTSNNQVACWGFTSSLGFKMPDDATDAVLSSNRKAIDLRGGAHPTGLAVGRAFACYAAKGDQPQIWCWGKGTKGQIGNARVESNRIPQCVKGYCPDTKAKENLVEGQPFDEAPGPAPSAWQVSNGFNETCAVMVGGSVMCWGATQHGEDSYGDIGDGYPHLIPGLDAGATYVSVGLNKQCALLDVGAVKCWGDLPDSPGAAIPGWESGVKSVSTSFEVTCVRKSDSTADCRHYPTYNWPTLPTDVKELVLGYSSLCVLLNSGGVKCVNFTDIEVSPTDESKLWFDIGFGSGVRHIAGSWDDYCAVLNDNSVECWTRGKTSSIPSGFTTPVAIKGLPPVSFVSVGAGHTCVITNAGGVLCWGTGTEGQLGNGTFKGSSAPVAVVGLQGGVVGLSAGGSSTCAILFDGTVKCWGNNVKGQLGVGDTENRNVPTPVLFGDKYGTRGAAVNKGENLTEGKTQMKVTVTIPTLTGDLGYGFDCDGDQTYEINGTVAGHECYYDKLPSGSYDIGYKVTMKGLFGNAEVTGTTHFSVQNLPPVIKTVDTDPTVIQAGSAGAKNFTIRSVAASDPGNDALTYNYDCKLNPQSLHVATADQGATNAVCDLSGFAPGTYSLSVIVTDSDNATQGDGQTIKPVTITITPPVSTQLDSTPLAYSGANVSFTFSSTPFTSTIETKLDGAAFAVTTAGMASYTALTDGTHTFYARAVSGGYPGTATSYAWIVDTVAPVTVSDTTFTQPVSTANVTVQFHATDANAAGGFTYQCQLDGGAWRGCYSGDATGPVSGEGLHTLVVAATDVAGNPTTSPATISWSYWIPPVTTLDASGPAEGSTVSQNTGTFTFSSPTATGFECQLDTGAWTACTSPYTTPTLGDGTHTVAIRAVRNGVASTTSSTRTFTVDTTPPDTTITASYANDTSGASYNIEFSCGGEAGCSFECKVDTGSFATCSSPYTALVSTEGSHTASVRALDALGNPDATPASVTWTVTFPAGGGGGGASVVTGATIAAGSVHGCAIVSGKMDCWGADLAGQLGDLTAAPGVSGYFMPNQMGSATDWASVSAGPNHTCAIKTSGALYCWGANSNGQLGDPNTSTYSGSSSPVTVAAGSAWLKVAAIDMHTCAIRSDQTLWCWGDTSQGQLGTGVVDYNPVTAPVQVGSATDWIDVGGGYAFTCALNASGNVYCWGDNNMGQLGTGDTNTFASPMTAAATGVASLNAGGQVVCAVKTDHTLWCWGDNSQSQGGGDGGATPYRTTATQVGTATDWKTVEAGITHVCGIKTGGTRWCWGDSTSNALGDDGTLSSTQLTPVQTDTTNSDWLELSCNQGFCIGVRDNAGAKDVFSWGDNGFNQCGVDDSGGTSTALTTKLTPFP